MYPKGQQDRSILLSVSVRVNDIVGFVVRLTGASMSLVLSRARSVLVRSKAVLLPLLKPERRSETWIWGCM